jgi:mono/diheme cytochrome c family protein
MCAQADRQQGAEVTNISKWASERAADFAVALAAVAIVFFAVAARAQAPSKSEQELPPLIRSTKGPDLFRAYCASCHGLDGKGDGPAASALKVKVPNLTLLAKNNGGTFSAARLRRTITGEEVMASHGSREMPIWGPIFHQVEEDIDRGNVRIENLLKYLESIQVSK